MRARILAIVSVLWGNACAAKASPASVTAPAEAARSAAPGFAFDWSPPCRVPVVENTEKAGGLARMRYVVSARRAADGNVEVSLQDFEMLEADGQDVTSPEWKRRLAPTMALVSAIPAMRVSPAGAYLGAERPEALLERLLAARHYPPEEEAAVRKQLSQPGAVESFDALIGEYWRGWVEDWVGWSLAPGESKQEQHDLPVEGGAVPGTLRYEYLGLHDGYASLRLTSIVEGPRVLQLSGVKGADLAKLAEIIADSRREQVASVETDPTTLRPRHTRSQLDVTVSFKDGTSTSVREVHDLSWDWTKAEGCGRRP